MLSNNFRHNFHLDPAPDGAAGGAANTGSPVGGDAAPAFDSSKFVPREDFDRVNSEFGEFRQTAEQRFQDYDSRLPKPEKQEAKADKAPSPADYDFSKEGQFEAFLDARTRFNANNLRKEWDSENSKVQREQSEREYVQSVQDAHAGRAETFRTINPDYNPQLSQIKPNSPVAFAILDSDYSAHIHHLLQKNPEKLKELQKIIRDQGETHGIRWVGRLEAQFEKQETAIPAKKTAAAASTTAGAFGGKSAGGRTKSNQEIFDEHHK